MLHKAWNSKGEMPYCFPRSSIKFQNITDFDPNWAFPDCRPVAAFKSLRFALFPQNHCNLSWYCICLSKHGPVYRNIAYIAVMAKLGWGLLKLRWLISPSAKFFILQKYPLDYYTQQSCWGVYWFHSVRPSIRPASRVRSVALTVLVGSISYL